MQFGEVIFEKTQAFRFLISSFPTTWMTKGKKNKTKHPFINSILTKIQNTKQTSRR